MNTKYYVKSSFNEEVTPETIQQIETFMNLLLSGSANKITSLDYYRNVKISIDSFRTILLNLNYSKRERAIFSRFASLYGQTEVEKPVEFFLSDSFKYGYRKYLDEKDHTKFIDVVISMEDKKEILEYFIENEIPLYTSLFYIAAKEKVEDTLYEKEVSRCPKKNYSL